MSSIHDKIRSERQTKQWTQEEMAEKLDMSTSGYAKIERGDTKLQVDKLLQIAQVLNIDVSELVESDKGMILLVNDSNHVNTNYYSSNEAILAELGKQKLELDYKNQLLEQKDHEIAALREIIELLKAK